VNSVGLLPASPRELWQAVEGPMRVTLAARVSTKPHLGHRSPYSKFSKIYEAMRKVLYTFSVRAKPAVSE
jgi:hypothetical protein